MVRAMTRRQALGLGAAGLTGVALGGAGLWREVATADVGVPTGGAAFTAPPELRSAGGVLRVDLSAAARSAQVDGRRVTALGYNGGMPGPTLRLRPGDRLQVRLSNDLTEPTNLHVHGLHVSPQGNGDNPFVSVGPGQSFDYDYQLPQDHPTGTFWYHPHLHGLVADQVFGGLYGAIVVEDTEQIPVSRERVLVVSDISFDGQGRLRDAGMQARMAGREGDLLLVNGQSAPRMSARPGERERWRVINACTSRYLRLAVDGQGVELLGVDFARSAPSLQVDDVVLAPGNRADLLITMRAGTSLVRTLGYDRGSTGMMGSQAAPSGLTLASVVVAGEPVTPAPNVPDPPAQRDLRGTAPARRRDLTLAMGMGMGMGMGMDMGFTIDGQRFDHERTDQQVQAAAVEEWHLHNSSPMDHPFHLHVWPMQLLEENGQIHARPAWRDVVNVPAGGTTVVRIAFDTFTGRTVYHCHILDHEDAGMMGTVEAR